MTVDQLVADFVRQLEAMIDRGVRELLDSARADAADDGLPKKPKRKRKRRSASARLQPERRSPAPRAKKVPTESPPGDDADSGEVRDERPLAGGERGPDACHDEQPAAGAGARPAAGPSSSTESTSSQTAEPAAGHIDSPAAGEPTKLPLFVASPRLEKEEVSPLVLGPDGTLKARAAPDPEPEIEQHVARAAAVPPGDAAAPAEADPAGRGVEAAGDAVEGVSLAAAAPASSEPRDAPHAHLLPATSHKSARRAHTGRSAVMPHVASRDADQVDDEELDSLTGTPLVKIRRRVRTSADGRVRSKTIAPGRLTKDERRLGELLVHPAGVERPVTREDCENDPGRPCPWVSCPHHLYLDVNVETGAIKLNFPHLEVWQMATSCSLDVADRGGITLEEVGSILNMTRERVRQIEVRGLDKIKRHADDELGLPPEHPESNLGAAVG